MSLSWRMSLYFCPLLFGFGPVFSQGPTWRTGITAQQATIIDGTDTVAVYRIAPTSRPDGSYARAHYLHPVYAPDGSLLTEDFPADHLHHRGIFWAWHQVYAGDRRAGDGWDCQNFSWGVSAVRAVRRGRRLDVHATVVWRSRLSGSEQPVMLAQEKVRIRFHPVRKGQRRIDFRIDIEPRVANLAIGGSEDAKGYSGFSWRLPLPEDIAFYSEGEQLVPTETAIPAGRKLRLEGTFSKGYRRLAIEQVRQPGGPSPWILRKQNSMQNVAFPGRELLRIPARGIRLKYRIRL